jgi:hypothetical protein
MFKSHGVVIIDPFLDESGRFEVNPAKYYGKNFFDSNYFKQLPLIKKLKYKLQYKISKLSHK